MGFVEAVSPCPTQYGRRNRHEDLGALYDAVEGLCITEEQARELTGDERRGLFVVGEWSRDGS